MWRIYCFNLQMEVVYMEDTLADKDAAHKRGEYLVGYFDLYTYALGKII